MQSSQDLLSQIEALYARSAAELSQTRDQAREVFAAFLNAVEAGQLRAASKGDDGQWVVHPQVKQGILLGFRLGSIEEMELGGLLFSDKDTYPAQRLPVLDRQIRIVPGGNSVRRGAYLGPRVTMMPPAFVNVGAYVDEGTMIDSHALVGSCAQIGKRVHLSAAAQVGGVLEPIGQSPVIIEDDVMVGGNAGLYEGVRVCERAVIGAGVILTASTPVYDLVHQEIRRASPGQPLVIPAGAVVIPGARPARGEFAQAHGLMLAAPMIVKYRDEKTDSSTALEEALR